MKRGFSAIGIYNSKTPENLGTLWRSASIYDADFIFTVNKRYDRQSSDTMKSWRHKPLFHYFSIDDLIDHLPKSCPLVGVEFDVQNGYPLHQYIHPERAAYLLGAEDSGLSSHVLERCHQLVYIESPQPYCLNVATAGSMILYDRFIKNND